MDYMDLYLHFDLNNYVIKCLSMGYICVCMP